MQPQQQLGRQLSQNGWGGSHGAPQAIGTPRGFQTLNPAANGFQPQSAVGTSAVSGYSGQLPNGQSGQASYSGLNGVFTNGSGTMARAGSSGGYTMPGRQPAPAASMAPGPGISNGGSRGFQAFQRSTSKPDGGRFGAGEGQNFGQSFGHSIQHGWQPPPPPPPQQANGRHNGQLGRAGDAALARRQQQEAAAAEVLAMDGTAARRDPVALSKRRAQLQESFCCPITRVRLPAVCSQSVRAA